MGRRYDIDWHKIEREYLNKDISIRDLAEKHKVGYVQIARRAKKGAWLERRNVVKKEVAVKVSEKTIDQRAERIALYERTAHPLAHNILKYVNGALQVSKSNPTAQDAKALASAFAIINKELRLILGLSTENISTKTTVSMSKNEAIEQIIDRLPPEVRDKMLSELEGESG